ncbi:MAG: laccase domain-containing protein, partial [Syntrophaceae bacterium]|nr:laccase domain-containing protein [Syntrophaceae bacterium]
RGTALGITAKVARLMQTSYRSEPADLLAAIGPSIGGCCYEVDAATADAFSGQKSDAILRPGKKDGKWMLDLVEANRRQLLCCGLPAANIEAAGLCTVCHPEAFFSHRGSGGVTGRQVNFVMLRGTTPGRAFVLKDDFQRLH